MAGTEHSHLARPNQEHVQEDSRFMVAPGEQHAGVGVNLGSHQSLPLGLHEKDTWHSNPLKFLGRVEACLELFEVLFSKICGPYYTEELAQPHKGLKIASLQTCRFFPHDSKAWRACWLPRRHPPTHTHSSRHRQTKAGLKALPAGAFQGTPPTAKAWP